MNVVSFSSIIIVVTIIDLEQDLELPKSMKRSKNMNLAINFNMFGWLDCMGRIYYKGDGLVSFVRCILYSKLKVKKNY
jgi:hypothetical protein